MGRKTTQICRRIFKNLAPSFKLRLSFPFTGKRTASPRGRESPDKNAQKGRLVASLHYAFAVGETQNRAV